MHDTEPSMASTDPLPPAMPGWRPRFSVRGLLTLTLIVALVAGLLVQHRQLRQADEILVSHGLKWDRPLADDEFRLHVVYEYADPSTEMRLLMFRIQSSTPATFTTEGSSSFHPLPLLQSETGVFTGDYFIQAELFDNPPGSGGGRTEISRRHASGMGQKGSVMQSGYDSTVTEGMSYYLDPLAKSGIYKRNTAIPIYRWHGVLTQLRVQ